MTRVARMRDGREMQGEAAGRDAVGVRYPVEERPAGSPQQVAARSRSQQRVMDGPGCPGP